MIFENYVCSALQWIHLKGRSPEAGVPKEYCAMSDRRFADGMRHSYIVTRTALMYDEA
jgi:hypothetical protein